MTYQYHFQVHVHFSKYYIYSSNRIKQETVKPGSVSISPGTSIADMPPKRGLDWIKIIDDCLKLSYNIRKSNIKFQSNSYIRSEITLPVLI